MQGIIVAPNGDVWALGISKDQLLRFPKGDLNKGRIVCEGRDVASRSWVRFILALINRIGFG